MSMFIELNPDMSPEEMQAAIKKNEATARTLKNKIKAIDAIQRETSNFNVEIPSEVKKEIENEIEEIEDEEEEFKYYYDNMIEAISSTNDIRQAVIDSLPVKENGNYVNIIRRIILELMKDRKVYDELLTGDTIADEEVIVEQERIDYIIELVRNHHTIKEEEYLMADKTKNNIIFLKTTSGNVYAEQDLASIDSEYYPGFKELLESMEDGTFKNIKKFSAVHQLLKGIIEIKEHGIRIVFDKINKDTYIVLDIFVKRSNCDMGYVHQLTNRVATYKKVEDDIKSTISEDIIENDRVILENIKKGLDNKYIVKTKGGDTNEL